MAEVGNVAGGEAGFDDEGVASLAFDVDLGDVGHCCCWLVVACVCW